MAYESAGTIERPADPGKAPVPHFWRALASAAILIACLIFVGYLIVPLMQAFGYGAIQPMLILLAVIRVVIAAGALLLAARRPILALPAAGVIAVATVFGFLVQPFLLYARFGPAGPPLLSWIAPALFVTAWLVARGRPARSYLAVAAAAVAMYGVGLLSMFAANPSPWRSYPPYFVYLEAAVLIGAAWLGYALDPRRGAEKRGDIRVTAAVPAEPVAVDGYGASGYPTVPALPGHSQGYVRTNGLAIASLIVVFFSSVVGLVLGHVALSQIRRTGEGGRGLALAAVIIGWVATALAAVLAVVYVIALANIRPTGF